ncbi:MAG: hypothetical protein PWP37_1843 [Thermotogota bacterium]|nr:hypothetical protein [Thermotogota bacterium]
MHIKLGDHRGFIKLGECGRITKAECIVYRSRGGERVDALRKFKKAIMEIPFLDELLEFEHKNGISVEELVALDNIRYVKTFGELDFDFCFTFDPDTEVLEEYQKLIEDSKRQLEGMVEDYYYDSAGVPYDLLGVSTDPWLLSGDEDLDDEWMKMMADAIVFMETEMHDLFHGIWNMRDKVMAVWKERFLKIIEEENLDPEKVNRILSEIFQWRRALLEKAHDSPKEKPPIQNSSSYEPYESECVEDITEVKFLGEDIEISTENLDDPPF